MNTGGVVQQNALRTLVCVQGPHSAAIMEVGLKPLKEDEIEG